MPRRVLGTDVPDAYNDHNYRMNVAPRPSEITENHRNALIRSEDMIQQQRQFNEEMRGTIAVGEYYDLFIELSRVQQFYQTLDQLTLPVLQPYEPRINHYENALCVDINLQINGGLFKFVVGQAHPGPTNGVIIVPSNAIQRARLKTAQVEESIKMYRQQQIEKFNSEVQKRAKTAGPKLRQMR